MQEIKKSILDKIKMELNHINNNSSLATDKDLSETVKNLSEAYKNLK